VSDRRRDDDDEAAWLLAIEHGQAAPAMPAALAARYQRLSSLIHELPAIPGGVPLPPDWERGLRATLDAAAAAGAAKAPEAPTPEIEPPTPAAKAPEAPTPEIEPPAPEPSPPVPGPPAQEAAAAPAIAGGAPPPVPRRARRRHLGVASAAVAATAALVVLVVSREASHDERGPSLALELVPGARSHRGSDPSVGDTLIVRGVVDGPGELRVYDDNGVEQARCAAAAPDCALDRDGRRTTLRLTLRLRVPGELRPVLFTTPLVGQAGGRDADLDAATRAGIAFLAHDPVYVH
jgi:hypothetical protein